MANYPLPPIQVNVGFASHPLDQPQTWTDISHLVKAVKVIRGRQHTLNRFEAGTLEVTCYGNDGSLDPFNPASPYYPNIDANKQIQVLTYWNLLTAAQAGGTLDWKATAISSGWTAGAHTTVSYSGGYLLLTATATGGMAAQTPTGTSAAYAFVQPGNPYTGMASFWGGNAATITPGTVRSCSVTLTFYNASGASLGSTAGTAGNDSNATSGGLPVWTTLSVQAVAPANAVYAALTVTTAASATSEVHSVQQPSIHPAVGVGPLVGAVPGTAPPGGAVPLFTGFIDQVNPVWLDNLQTDVKITATDALRLLDTDTILSPYQTLLADSGASHSWPLGDAPGDLTAADLFGSGFPFAYQGGYTLDQVGPSFTDPTTAVLFDGFSGHAVVDTSGTSAAGPIILDAATWELNFWFNSSTIPTLGQTQALYTQPSTGASFLTVGLTNSYGTAQITVAFGTTGTAATLASPAAYNYADGNWHFVEVTFGSSQLELVIDRNAPLFVNSLTPAAHAPSSAAVGGPATASMYGGAGNPKPSFFAGTMAYVSVWNSGSGGATDASLYLSGNTGFPLSDSGTRQNLILVGLADQPISLQPSPPLFFSLGYSLVQQPSGDLTAESVLSYMQEIEKAENGYLYADANGFLRFLNRYSILISPRNVSLGTFGENEVPYLAQPDAGLDNIDLYTQSVVSRQGGLNQTASSGTQQQYGVSSALVETGLLLVSDAECLNRAQWNTQTYGQTQARIRSITVDPLGDPTTRFPLVLYREVMDRVTFKRRPWDSTSGGFRSPAFAQDQYLEGITHEIDKQTPSWKATYNMWPATINAPLFIIGDSVNGVIGTSQLGY